MTSIVSICNFFKTRKENDDHAFKQLVGIVLAVMPDPEGSVPGPDAVAAKCLAVGTTVIFMSLICHQRDLRVCLEGAAEYGEFLREKRDTLSYIYRLMFQN